MRAPRDIASAFLLAFLFLLAARSTPAGEASHENPPREDPSKEVRIEILPGESFVVFELPATLHTVVGRTGKVTGKVSAVPSDILHTGKAEVSVDPATLDTGIGRRDKTMREDVLEVSKHPAITFASTGIEKMDKVDLGLRKASLVIRGKMGLHGVTKEISVPLRLKDEGGRFVAEGSFEIALRDYGIEPPAFLLFTTGETASVTFRIVGEVKPAAP